MIDQRTAAMYRAHMLGATLAEVGAEHGISRERVRQLFEDAGLHPRTRGAAHAARHDRMVARAQALAPEIKEMLADGYGEHDVATRFDLTLAAIRDVSALTFSS